MRDVHQGAVNKMMERHGHRLGDAPCFDSYDGCCKNVGQQGERQICYLRAADDVADVKTLYEQTFSKGNDHNDAHWDRKQVKDWK